jgi:ketosteroid isomerase-like protein
VSQENIEIVRRADALTNAGDLDAALELSHPDLEWVIAKEHPDARTLVGRTAIAEYRREWQRLLPDVQADMDRYLDAGDRVVAVGSVHGTGSGSGAGVRVPIAFVFTLRDGLIARVEEYLDPAEALEVAGLEG